MVNDKIINQISELMQVSYDKALELYPIVKTQFLWYEFFDNIINILIVCLIFEAAILLSVGYLYITDGEYDEFDYKKYIKIAIWALIITLVLTVGVYGAKLILAPDIVFVKGLLGGK